MKGDRVGIAALAAISLMAAAPAAARQETTQQPVLVTADRISHDRDLGTVTATGSVEVNQSGQTLLADALSYNLKQDVITASGNVSLTDADGNVSFAEYMELTGDMKRGAVRGIRMLMTDDSRMAAASARRTDGNRNVFNKGVYSPCETCAEDPSKPPLWNVKADRITFDQAAHTVEYEDAWIEISGVPVLYTPYLEHPDATIKRKNGFLAPTIINNRVLGAGVRLPYFYVIDDHQDLTLSPLLTSKDSQQLAALHRWRSMHGEGKTAVSVSNLPDWGDDRQDRFGWHVNGTALFDLDETWRAGWQVQRASDRDYLRTYNFSVEDPFLTTRPYVEGFGYRSYSSLEAYSFQNLTDMIPVRQTRNLQSRQPVILPVANYNFVGAPGAQGGYWSFDARAAAINRSEGTSSRRVNTMTAWTLPYTAPSGELYTLTASLRGDVYNSDHLVEDDSSQVSDYRAIPSLSMDWRFPFSKVGQASSQIVSPIIVGTLSPYGSNSDKIPNEDSLDFELDDVNVFSPTPFTGYDRVLTGPHVSYGLEYDFLDRGRTLVNVSAGQLYQVRPSSVFEPGSGVDDNFSDVVGRIAVSPSDVFDVSYRYRLSKEDGSIRRSEVDTTIGAAPLKLNLSYVYFTKAEDNAAFGQRQQIGATLSSRMSRYWYSELYTTQNIGSVSGNLQTGGRLVYDDECMMVSVDYGRRNTTLRTVATGNYMVLRVALKTLGEFPVSIF